MLANEIREYIIRPTLKVTNLWSPSAEILVYGSGMIETGYKFIIKAGNPPGGPLGFFQINPWIYKDLCAWMRVHIEKSMHEALLAACYYLTMPVDPHALASNIKFSALMCRMIYMRTKVELPAEDDYDQLARYYNRFYNARLGGDKIDQYTQIFQDIGEGRL